MKLLIVIVNYRTADLTIDCLRSLREEMRQLPDSRVVVTDNASGDDSVTRIVNAIQNERMHDWVKFMPLDRNGGFAYGNNEGMRGALKNHNPPEYVHLLNPDTLVLPGGVTELVKFMDAHPKVGIAGSRIENPDATVRRSAFRFHSIFGDFESEARLGLISRALNRFIVAPPVPESQAQVDWVSGASMIVRKEVLDQIGLLDDGYFMYYEEADFCLRARRAGWSCWYVPSSRIVHLVGQSSGVTGAKKAAKRRPKYWFDSRKRYFVNNHGPLTAFFADVAWAGGGAIHRVTQFVRRKERTDPPWLLWDFLRHSFLPPWRQRP